jgi:hypothetical protein
MLGHPTWHRGLQKVAERHDRLANDYLSGLPQLSPEAPNRLVKNYELDRLRPGGARNPHVLPYTLRFLRAVPTQTAFARCVFHQPTDENRAASLAQGFRHILASSGISE